MGLFNFGKKKNEIVLHSPLNGEVRALEEVPDQAFAEKIIGDGIAIQPSDEANIVVSNVSAEGNLSVFQTGHAFTLELGILEVLVHIGIETVSLKGAGFDVLVTEEKSYPVETEIVRVNRLEVEGRVPSLISPLIISNMDVVKSIEVLKPVGSTVSRGEALLKVLV